jgi:hypothetical protein
MRLTAEELSTIEESYLNSTPEEILLVLKAKGYAKRTLKCVVSKIAFFKARAEKRKQAREACEKKAKANIHQYRAAALYYAAKARTADKFKKYGRTSPFDIDIPWIEEKLRIGKCELSGIDLYIKEYEGQQGYKPINPRSASLDQINPGKGYTKDNVRVICDCLNKMLSDKTDGEIYDIVSQWVKHYETKNIIHSAKEVHKEFVEVENYAEVSM